MLLTPELLEFFNYKTNKMSLLQIYIEIDNYITRDYVTNLMNIDDKLNKILKLDNKVITSDELYNIIFKIIPIIMIDYNEYHIIVNKKTYSWYDLAIDRKMFKIALGYNDKTDKCIQFKSLPIDVLKYIFKYLHDGMIPFVNQYYFDLYQNNPKHNKEFVLFINSI